MGQTLPVAAQERRDCRSVGRWTEMTALAWPHAASLCPIWPTLVQAGEALRQTLTGYTGGVYAVAVSADGRTAVSGGGDGTVWVWDLAGDREQARWIAEGDVLAVAFSAAATVASDMAGQVHALQLNVPAAASA